MFALMAEGENIRNFGEGSTHTTIYFSKIRALHSCLAPLAYLKGASNEPARGAAMGTFSPGRHTSRSLLSRSLLKRRLRSRADPRSPPKVLEAVGRHVGVPDGVLDVLVPEVVLERSRVVAIVGELEPAGMAQHASARKARSLRCGGYLAA